MTVFYIKPKKVHISFCWVEEHWRNQNEARFGYSAASLQVHLPLTLTPLKLLHSFGDDKDALQENIHD